MPGNKKLDQKKGTTTQGIGGVWFGDSRAFETDGPLGLSGPYLEVDGATQTGIR